ncbi:PREDICTED: transcription factor bHLH30-like isoform X2 [Tarenaya hassleriana]|uniref:transcription factor bHLH30-like isoform X2 n=1 Tax=Tarenaya hassleriana TaxID=28532 RepID=UPI00053C1B41|nr:PREDICTED: transcription factor bHLH30-like isoform X2 [Tarenaya hassleriana]
MCAKKEEEGDCSRAMNNIQNYQNNLLLSQQQQPTSSDIFGTSNNAGFMSIFPQDHVSPVVPWPPPIQPFNPTRESDPFLLPSPPASFYGNFFNRSRFGYEGFGATSAHHHQHEHLRILSEALGPVVQAGTGHPFGLQAELGKMTAQEIMDAKALAASKSHSEAERRRRERINNHLAKLRSILPNTTKTDKASLLAEVIQHVKELKRQTSQIAETNPVPTETDEITVDVSEEAVEEQQDGKFVIKASICCDDRSDLLPDLIKTLKALRLKTLKAEITTVGCRVKNVLLVTGEESNIGDEQMYCIGSIQEALRAVMDKSSVEESSASGNAKRQRMSSNNGITIVEPQQQQQQQS